MRSWSASYLVLLMVVAGCSAQSGGLDDAVVDLSPAVAGPSIERVSPESSTSSTSSIAPATTTAMSSTGDLDVAVTRPIVEVPTEWDNDRDEIFGRYLLYFDLFEAMLAPPVADPADPELLAVLEGVLSSEALADALASVQQHRDDDLVVVFAENSEDEHVLRIPKVQPLGKEEGRKVLIQDCWLQDWEYHRGDGGFVEAVTDIVLFNATMEVVGGQWIVRSNIFQESDDVGFEWCLEVERSRQD